MLAGTCTGLAKEKVTLWLDIGRFGKEYSGAYAGRKTSIGIRDSVRFQTRAQVRNEGNSGSRFHEYPHPQVRTEGEIEPRISDIQHPQL